jgi:hypothetical protein
MEGFRLLERSYILELEQLGYQLVDAAPLARRLLDDLHPLLKAQHSTYRYWMLRWAVVEELNGPVSDRTAIHIDSDMVFVSDPNAVARDVAGKTVVMQGCPHFVAISRPDWFTTFQREVNQLLAHPREYMEAALRAADGPACPDREYCNVSAYRGTARLFHDQDMFEHLVAAGVLPQARTAEAHGSQFYWLQNPILPDEWHAEQCPDVERRFREEGGRIRTGDRDLAYFHFQDGFNRYSAQWLDCARAGLERPRADAFLTRVTRVSPPGQFARRVAKSLGIRRIQQRRAVYDEVFGRNAATGNLYVTDIVNSCWRSRA